MKPPFQFRLKSIFAVTTAIAALAALGTRISLDAIAALTFLAAVLSGFVFGVFMISFAAAAAIETAVSQVNGVLGWMRTGRGVRLHGRSASADKLESPDSKG